MDSTISNLLYRRPELYESVYDGADHAVPRLVEGLSERHLGGPPASILDVGCGTGRDLEFLSKRCADCVGVDYQPAMVDYARELRPGIDFRAGDMRTLRLGRTFQVVLNLGWAIAYLHANDDIDRAMATFAAHSEPGTMLVLEVIDPDRAGDLPRRFTIDTPEFAAHAAADYRPDPRAQLIERRRVWTVRDAAPVHDLVRFRLLYPMELTYYLANHGFAVTDVVDHAGPSLFFVATYGKKA